MFDGLTAWFSSSVDESIKQHWENNHGVVRDVDEAQFLFSQNSEIQDTKRLYESEAYLNEHLTIFHVQYINDCIKSGDRKKVVLGKYFLPPLEIQNLIRNQVEFIWEKDKGSIQSVQVNTGKRKTDGVLGGDNSSPVKSRCPRIIDAGVLGGDNSSPVKSRCPRVIDDGVLGADNSSPVKSKCSRVIETGTTTAVENSSPGKSRCSRVIDAGVTTSVENSSPVQSKCSTGMDTDSIHINDLPKIRGQIEDFIPGENGCEVFLKM
ncbi:uncharacterized protein LOC126817274 [Patella vulgata]|uniref:uncharacterized protein LOC126817274 n=1 Tax=Patella vulgata TaxID=6465 RepID=UPI0024A81A7F|nr:uncharacterized protein LOC126817274 [Patella vulgata]XP_055956466.1 uncharacterized protein LOC126817274 [Patella vulgata]